MSRLLSLFILGALTASAVADNSAYNTVAAQRKWLEAHVIGSEKDKKRRQQMQAQLARMNPRQIMLTAKRYQTLYDRQRAAADRYSTQSPGQQRAAQKAQQAAAARRNRMQSARNVPGGFSPVLRNLPGGGQQPPNPIRTVPLPQRATPVLRPNPFPFVIKNGYAPGRSTPGWYKKVRSR